MSSFFQYLIPHHLLSRFIGLFTECRYPAFKNWLIDWFIKRYKVDMSCALQTDPHAYQHFNDFFTRYLKADARPFVTGSADIAFPVDGVISQVGDIKAGRVVQAKNFDFSVLELLGGSAQRAASFQNGKFITLYLAPKDYHRIHMPASGELTEMVHIPGRLFSVNPATAATIPRLFTRNERVATLFSTPAGPMAVVLVGAMIVASINTVWHGEVTPPGKKNVSQWVYPPGKELIRGDEIGSFKLGSTVVVLFGPQMMEWIENLKPEMDVKLGELMGMFKEKQVSI